MADPIDKENLKSTDAAPATANPKGAATSAKVKAKPIKKPAAKAAVKPAAKTPAKAAAKPAKKPVAKAKASTAKASAKSAAPAAKAGVKPAPKPAAKATGKKALSDKSVKSKKSTATKVEKKIKPKKNKQVRDSFTMPENEYALFAAVKKRCVAKGVVAKKSEVLRAAIITFAAQSDTAVIAAMQALEVIKTGRKPKNHK